MNISQGLRTWIEIDLKKLHHNVEGLRSYIGNSTKVMGIVKSNAYGHGLVECSKALIEKKSVEWLGADSVTEALRLRHEGIMTPILVLGFTLPERGLEALQANISLTISNFEVLKTWSTVKLYQPLKIHIKVDTGLHRQGFLLHEMKELFEFLQLHKHLFEVEGLYTHFAEAKDPGSREYTERQHQEFLKWIEAAKNHEFSPLIHASATAGALLYPKARFDMVRVGIGMYGIWPSPQTEEYLRHEIKLEPILSWKTCISEVKKLPSGSRIGYNLTETLQQNSKIAVCPIGYWHGYPRSLSRIGEVLVHGKRAKVLGTIAMDMIVIDVTSIKNVKFGDEVVLVGAQDKGEITADEIAAKAGTTSYEFLTRLNPLMRRIYLP